MMRATKANVGIGARLVPDGGFGCLPMGRSCEVHEDQHGLCVICEQGRHYLDGQLNDLGEYAGFHVFSLADEPIDIVRCAAGSPALTDPGGGIVAAPAKPTGGG